MLIIKVLHFLFNHYVQLQTIFLVRFLLLFNKIDWISSRRKKKNTMFLFFPLVGVQHAYTNSIKFKQQILFGHSIYSYQQTQICLNAPLIHAAWKKNELWIEILSYKQTNNNEMLNISILSTSRFRRNKSHFHFYPTSPYHVQRNGQDEKIYPLSISNQLAKQLCHQHKKQLKKYSCEVTGEN